MIKGKIASLFILIAYCTICVSQNVPIINYSVSNTGQVELEIAAEADQYYLLTTRHQPDFLYESNTSITAGIDGNMIISEPLEAYPIESYKITAFDINAPVDTDGDGIDDVSELNNMPTQAPLNFAEAIPFNDGTTSIPNSDIYSELAVIDDDIPWAPFLNNQEFAKFVILNQDSERPEIYFINSKTHYIHADFLATIDTNGDEITSGEIVYNPNDILPNGVVGSYSFNYSFGAAESFLSTQKTFELLAASMPFLQNNFKHFIGDFGESAYNNIKDDYIGSRIDVVLESELFSDVDFLPFNQAEGFGFFRLMALDENPGSRDVVLYEALPNSLPRVGGIITSVIQTPLSHVNLRAIQDNVPNAYIRNPLEIDSISNLIGKYIYYKVEQDKYEIREASIEEVNDWFDSIRPTEDQIPDRDLSQTEILPLDEIEFDMANAFGAKCSNVATMRKFGFPEGTIPNGFGVPFYYYDEFMKFNDFYEQADEMINDPDFISDLEVRIDMLKDFRRDIKDADMPQWMLDSLDVMHKSFPEGTSIRCRSSTNNEDLPGFSGAGLYTSKTQHPDEGHIQKSIKQVYASMWNFRAFDEREFYRVDQYIAAMGVLCHPNYDEEKSNGVGVSIDPVYETENTFYLNTQVGESLITNPEANAVPEEILLSTDPSEGFTVLRYSNLVLNNDLVMSEAYLDLMREYLQVIHNEFAILYNVVGADGFGMDIEYKVTVDDRLIIKQARPWVSFWSEIKSNFDLAVVDLIEPQSSASLSDSELITVQVRNAGLREMKDFELTLLVDDQLIETMEISDQLSPLSIADYQFTVPVDMSLIDEYNIDLVVSHPSDGYDKNDTLRTEVSKLHLLEAGLEVVLDQVQCGEEIDLFARVTNNGEATFSNTEIEIVVNGVVTDTVTYDFNIPYLSIVDIRFTVTENLQETDNVITANLLTVNGQSDAISENNSSNIETSLDVEKNIVTLIINADDYPEETSWQIIDIENNTSVASGSLSAGTEIYIEDICVDYSACYNLFVYDTYSDGICCAYGIGDFKLLNADGEVLVENDGDFGSEAEEFFCPGGACILDAELVVTIASGEDATDGEISINASNGIEPYQYSIDGGLTFSNNPVFSNLAPGTYIIMVQDATGNCFFEESIELGFDVMNAIDETEIGILKVYPNPTSDIITLEFVDGFDLSGDLKIEVYNSLGGLIYRNSISEYNSESKTTISLVNYPSGGYFVKCYNQGFEKYLKVIKR